MEDNARAIESIQPEKVLLLEDDKTTSLLVTNILQKRGFVVQAVDSKSALLGSLESFEPQVVILDSLPELSCEQSCELVRSRPATANLPVVIYSGIYEETRMIDLLRKGADRVIPKDFSPQVLAAEVAAILRLYGQKNDRPKETIYLGDLTLDPRKNQAVLNKQPIKLTHSEFKVLYILARFLDRVVSREEIIAFLHHDGFKASDRLVDVFILRLRRKLADWNGHIMTVRGAGYQLLP